MRQARLVEPEKVILEEVEKPEPGEDYPKAFEYIEQHRDKTMKVLIDL